MRERDRGGERERGRKGKAAGPSCRDRVEGGGEREGERDREKRRERERWR